jgi:hypothetical protein
MKHSRPERGIKLKCSTHLLFLGFVCSFAVLLEFVFPLLPLSNNEQFGHLDEALHLSTYRNRRRSLPRIANCTTVRTKGDEVVDTGERSMGSCALLFFGLAKQFKSLVLPTIRKNILQVGDNHHCDVFAHTYDLTAIYNSRNQELGAKIDPSEIYELTQNVMMESIQDFERQHNMTHLLQPRFFVHRKHGWTPQSYVNMLRQWHSIEKVWKLMVENEKKTGVQYERVGLFRSDVFYVSPIDIGKGDAVIPAFGLMTNDRMFYGKYEHAYVWANIRFPSVDCYKPPKSTHGLHSEHFMRRLILPNIPNWTINDKICFLRVRGQGKIQKKDCIYNYTGSYGILG